MARHKGHKGYAEVGTTEISERVSFDIEITSNELDASTMGNEWTDTDGGQLSASGSIEVFYDPSDAGQGDLEVGSTITLKLYPGGDTAGLEEISGSFLITSSSIAVPVGDLVKKTIQVKNKLAVTIATVA